MNNASAWKLTRLYYKNTLGINKLLKSKKKNKYIIFALWCFLFLYVGAAFIFTSGFYSYMLTEQFTALGVDANLSITLMMTAASIISIVSSAFSVKGMLLCLRDHDLLMAMPVPAGKIAASRLLNVYLMNFVISLFALVPSFAANAIIGGFSQTKAVIFFITLPVVVLLPTIIGCLVGIVLLLATSGMKKSNTASIILSFIFLACLMYFSFKSGDVENMGGIAAVIMDKVVRMYFPASWYNSMLGGNIASLVCFAGVSVASAFVLSFLFAKNLSRMNARITGVKSKGDFSIAKNGVKSGSAFGALFVREARRYFSSVIYVTNTLFGSVLMVIASVAIWFVGDETIAMLVSNSAMPAGLIDFVLPYAIGFCVMVGCTSVSSVSLEGNRIWILKSLPVDTVRILGVKVLLSFVLSAPAAVLAAISVGLRLSLNPGVIAVTVMHCLAYVVFCSVFGLIINLLFPKMQWQNDAEVVKQSASVMVAMFSNMVLLAIIVFAGIYTGAGSVMLNLAVAVVFIIVDAVMWKLISGWGTKKFLKIN
ncbi:MAG: hypothetical protein VB118_08325 [Oscillospiraceae bacterium]|nr:hypothetical protein [Oscillospiraceae bacterium]